MAFNSFEEAETQLTDFSNHRLSDNGSQQNIFPYGDIASYHGEEALKYSNCICYYGCGSESAFMDPEKLSRTMVKGIKSCLHFGKESFQGNLDYHHKGTLDDAKINLESNAEIMGEKDCILSGGVDLLNSKVLSGDSFKLKGLKTFRLYLLSEYKTSDMEEFSKTILLEGEISSVEDVKTGSKLHKTGTAEISSVYREVKIKLRKTGLAIAEISSVDREVKIKLRKTSLAIAEISSVDRKVVKIKSKLHKASSAIAEISSGEDVKIKSKPDKTSCISTIAEISSGEDVSKPDETSPSSTIAEISSGEDVSKPDETSCSSTIAEISSGEDVSKPDETSCSSTIAEISSGEGESKTSCSSTITEISSGEDVKIKSKPDETGGSSTIAEISSVEDVSKPDETSCSSTIAEILSREDVKIKSKPHRTTTTAEISSGEDEPDVNPQDQSIQRRQPTKSRKFAHLVRLHCPSKELKSRKPLYVKIVNSPTSSDCPRQLSASAYANSHWHFEQSEDCFYIYLNSDELLEDESDNTDSTPTRQRIKRNMNKEKREALKVSHILYLSESSHGSCKEMPSVLLEENLVNNKYFPEFL